MDFSTIQAAQRQATRGPGQTLGTILWWSLDSNRIDHDALVDLSGKHGLDAKYLPRELSPVRAFRRGCRHASSRLPEGMMLRPIADTDRELVVGLVRERVDEVSRDLQYDVVTRIVFNKDTASITAELENGVSSTVRKLYHHHQAHTTQDIRGMLTMFLREAGVSLRESGGVYFVPATHQATLDALCAVVESAGRNQTFQLPIVDTEAGRKALTQVAKRNLDDEIRQLHDDLQRFDHDKVRQSTLERKLEGFDDLRSRVNLFARVLAFKADALNRKISAIQSNLRGQLRHEDTPPPRAISPTPMQSLGHAMVAAASDVGF